MLGALFYSEKPAVQENEFCHSGDQREIDKMRYFSLYYVYLNSQTDLLRSYVEAYHGPK